MVLQGNYRNKMRDNISRLSKGYVEYTHPTVDIKPVALELSVQEGEVAEGVVSVTVKDGGVVYGNAISHNLRMEIQNPDFAGEDANIKYRFDATGLEPGEVIKGEICLIMDAGEFVIPYVVFILHGDIETDAGPVKNLFHFTNLAQEDYQRAKDIFYSDAFGSLIANSDNQYFGIYRGFSQGTKCDENFDAFLRTVKKKNPSTYSFYSPALEDGLFKITCFSDRQEEITVVRDGWGNCSFEVISDCDFLTPINTTLTEDDFIDQEALLSIDITEDDLHEGLNFGRIILKGADGEFEARFCVKKEREEEGEAMRLRRRMQAYRAELLKSYIAYKIRNISRSEWEEKFKALTDRLLEIDPEDLVSRLSRAHSLLVLGRLGEATSLIDELMDEARSAGPLEYGYCIFLSSMASDSSDHITNCCRLVSRLFIEHPEQDTLLWLLTQMDDDMNSDPAMTLKTIKHQYNTQGVGPLLYLKAYELFSQDPELMSEVKSFEIQVMNFAVKTGLFDEQLSKRFSQLIKEERSYDPVALRVLKAMYEEYKDNEYLGCVCMLYMKENRLDEDAFEWYLTAVEKDVNITRLFEIFIDALPVDYAKELPAPVQLYFSYGASLEPVRKAALFANIIQYHSQNPEIMTSYDPQILEFAKQQAERGNIDARLSVIYAYLKDNEEFIPIFEKNAASFVFAHHVTCAKDAPDHLIVVEEAFASERKVDFSRGEACVSIYGSSYELFGEYEDGRRIYGDIFEDEALFFPQDYEDKLRSGEGEGDIRSAVYFSERMERANIPDEQSYRHLLTLAQSDEIRSLFKRPFIVKLLRYYEDDDSHSFDLMDKLDISALDSAGRAELLELLMHKGRYGNALDIIKRYGINGVSSRLLVKLLVSMRKELENEDEPLVLWLCSECFAMGKYDGMLLKFLCDNLRDTTRTMRSLWRAARDFDIDTRALEERLLIQMMFTGAYVGDRDDIFESYESHIAIPLVEMAWVTKCSYDYAILDEMMDERFFARLLKMKGQGNALNDYCALALIQYFSSQRREYGEKLLLVEPVKEILAEFIRDFLAKKIMLSCFMEFKDLVPELSMYEGYVFIEHKAAPDSVVTLNYIVEASSEAGTDYTRMSMRMALPGIFCASFMLFHTEQLKYYISIEQGGHAAITESARLDAPYRSGETSNKYEVLNEMYSCLESEDREKLIEMMEVYRRREYTGKALFRPITQMDA